MIVLCLICCLLYNGFGLGAPVANIPATEMQALHDLYNATRGDQWFWRQTSQAIGIPWNFTPTANPCHDNWQGINCNYQAPYNHISSLTLISYNLTGQLPDSISQLTNLNIMEITLNILSGTIPATFGLLTKLQILELSSNSLTGTLPSTFANLVNLRQLGVYANRLTGPIPDMFGKMNQLNFLSLAFNNLNGTLPTSITRLPLLSILYFFNNELTGTIPESYANLTGLSDLYLEENQLSGKIPAVLGNLTKLRNIDLSNNVLTGTIPPSIGRLSNLLNFYAHTNKLSGSIPETVGGMTSLHFLDVSSNRLTGTLPAIMGDLTLLQYIQLNINKLSGEIPVELYKLSGLQQLDLNTNNFVGTIPQSLFFWPELLLFDLSSNKFTGTVPQAVVNLTLVQYMALNDNILSGPVPTALSTLSQLSVLHLQDNKLTGPLTAVFNATLQTTLAAVEVSNNQFSGPLPDQLFQLSALSSLVAVGNCFYGEIPGAVCNASKLVSLVLDGLSSAHRCRSTLLEGVSSSYVIKRTVSGKLPPCLFQLPELTTLHLSGNGFTGSLPELTLSPSLVDMIISHNRLTGSIPPQMQERRWYNLDLSYNRLSGTLISDVETRKVNITATVQAYIKPVYGFMFTNATIVPSLSLENNRISGRVPSSLMNFANISVLGSNMFECDLQGSDLPMHDSGRNNYECGSARFDITYYIWLVMVGIVLIIVALLRCLGRKERTILTKAEAYLAVWEQYSNLGDHFKARLTTFGHLLDIICRMAVLCATFTVVALMPVYVACSYYYGTYTHSYAWAVSAAYQSGAVPVGLEVPLLLALLGVVLVVFTRRMAQLGSRTVQQHRMGSTRDAHLQQHIVAVSLQQKVIIYTVYTLVNLMVVIGVNVTYVYIAIYQGSALLVFAQIALSFFKLLWNNVCSVKLMRLIVQTTIADESDEVDNYAETQFVSLQIFVALLNSIAIPCMVVAVISPSCFYNVFVAPPTVNSFYTYQYCSVFSEAGVCTFYQTKVGTTSYSPPFTYSYQCSSSLITYYAPAFVNLCIISTIATPVAMYTTQRLLNQAKPGTPWYYVLDFVTSNMLKVKLMTAKPREGATFVRANQMLTILITYLGMLLTFGAMFPPLAVALALTVSIFVLVAKLKIGKFLFDAAERGFTDLVDKVDMECHGVGAISVLKNAMWMLITVSCCFYTLFLFDTLGNQIGFKNSFWLLFVVPAMPAVMYVAHKLVLKRCIVSMDHDESAEHTGGGSGADAAEKDVVSMELPEVPASRSRHNTAADLKKSIAAAQDLEDLCDDEEEGEGPARIVTYNVMLKEV